MKKIQEAAVLSALQEGRSSAEKKYKQAVKEVSMLNRKLEAVFQLKRKPTTFTIKPMDFGPSQSCAVMLASDWHVEEIVEAKAVNGLNSYNPDKAKERATMYFQRGLRLIKMFQQDTTIKTVVLALLGDFITNDLHEESAENNAMPPVEAALYAQSLLVSGLEFMLNHSKLNFVVPCTSGNHGRFTHKVHHQKERGHSLEHFMYKSIEEKFKSEKRIKFMVAEGYHTFLDVFGLTLRLHHGHMVQYHGGIGGITIPVKKAIAGWNRAKQSDLDCFGHFHQYLDGGSFVANGSMIGYNAYAVAIKAEYEEPKQMMFLVHAERGKTVVAPILFS